VAAFCECGNESGFHKQWGILTTGMVINFSRTTLRGVSHEHYNMAVLVMHSIGLVTHGCVEPTGKHVNLEPQLCVAVKNFPCHHPTKA
jgi:hypothetical protein